MTLIHQSNNVVPFARVLDSVANDSPFRVLADSTAFADIAFSHAFQPIVDPVNRRVASYELLIRGPSGEPAGTVFRKVDEREALAFDQHSREVALCTASSLGLDCKINLNFSPGALVLDNGILLEWTLAAAERVGISPSQLVVELTEGEAIKDYGELKRLINRYRRLHVTFAIDDFGSGYAGLNMLAEIQPEMIKLDMELVRSIEGQGPRQSIVKAICEVCIDLGIDTIAEGVETVEEFRFLETLNVDLYQGYLFAKPGFECLPPVAWVNV